MKKKFIFAVLITFMCAFINVNAEVPKVNTNFIGTAFQYPVKVIGGIDAAAHGQRDRPAAQRIGSIGDNAEAEDHEHHEIFTAVRAVVRGRRG